MNPYRWLIFNYF